MLACCLVPHSLIFPYDDYFRVTVGNHDALVRHFEAWVSSFASPGAGGGVVAVDLDPLQKYIRRQQYSWLVSYYSIRGALFRVLLPAIRIFLAQIVRCVPITTWVVHKLEKGN